MSGSDQDPFPRLLRGLLRPLVRTLIARGLTAPDFYRMIKRIYVDVAQSDFRIDDAPPTDSRISLLTGVHRRDVRTFLEEGDAGWEDTRRREAVFATVLGQWMARPEYTDETGLPKPLRRAGTTGGDFESLVRSVSTDIRPRTVLDELVRQGLVTETDDGLLEVATDAVSGPGGEESKLVFFAANVGDHIAAASENLLSDTPPFYERAVFYTRLTGASVDEIEESARGLAQDMLVQINRVGAEAQERDRTAEDNGSRFRMGVYFYRTDGSDRDQATAASRAKAAAQDGEDDGDS